MHNFSAQFPFLYNPTIFLTSAPIDVQGKKSLRLTFFVISQILPVIIRETHKESLMSQFLFATLSVHLCIYVGEEVGALTYSYGSNPFFQSYCLCDTEIFKVSATILPVAHFDSSTCYVLINETNVIRLRINLCLNNNKFLLITHRMLLKQILSTKLYKLLMATLYFLSYYLAAWRSF